MSKVLALDLGSKFTGVALSDAKKQLGFLREEIPSQDQAFLLKELLSLIEREGVDTLVLGLPLLQDGFEGRQAGEVRAFAALIEDKTGLSVHFVDERFTSVQAKQKAGKQARVDSEAALLLLQSFLSQNID